MSIVRCRGKCGNSGLLGPNRFLLSGTNPPMKNKNACFAVAVGVFLLGAQPCPAQWTQTSGPSVTYVHSLAGKGTMLYAGTTSGVFVSPDNGATWTARNNGLTTLEAWSLCICDSLLFAGTRGGGAFLSHDDGLTWKAINGGLTNVNVYSFAVVGSTVFAGTGGSGVFVLNRGTETWAPSNSGLSMAEVYALVAVGQSLYAGIEASTGVYVSTGGGAWTAAITAGCPSSVFGFARIDTLLFAATDCCNGVYSTSINAINWKEAGPGVNYHFSCTICAVGTTLYVGTNMTGVLRSTNYGQSWSSVNSGLPANPSVYCFATCGSNLFCGTYGSGVFRMPVPVSTEKPFGEMPAEPVSFKVVPCASNQEEILVRLHLDKAQPLTIELYDVAGRQISRLERERQSAGTHMLAVTLGSIAKGFYLVQLRTESCTVRGIINLF